MIDWSKKKEVGLIAAVVASLCVICLAVSLFSSRKGVPFLFKCKECGALFVSKIPLPPELPIIRACPKGHRAGFRVEVLISPDDTEKILYEEDLPEDRRPYKVATEDKIRELSGSKR